jgi:hypothetical protein
VSDKELTDLFCKIQDWLRPDGQDNSDVAVTIGFMVDQAGENGLLAIRNPAATQEKDRARVLPYYPLGDGEAQRLKILIATLRGMGIVKWDNSIVNPAMMSGKREVDGG